MKRRFPDDMPTGVFLCDAATNDPVKIKELLMQKKKFAWLVRLIPPRVVMALLPHLPMKLLKMGEVIITGEGGKQARIVTWGYPDYPARMLRRPERTVRRLVSLARYLEAKGAKAICLGANTAIVGDKGRTIERSVAIPVTNGNRLTDAFVKKAALHLFELLGLEPGNLTLTVVGSGGSVGDGVCRLFLELGIGKLFVVGSALGKQRKQAEELSTVFGIPVEERTLRDALRESNLAVFASSASSSGQTHDLDLADLPLGLIVIDMERPRDVSKQLAQCPWVLPNDGGMVAIQSEGKAGLGLPEGVFYPCFSELGLFLLRGWKNKWCYPAYLQEIKDVMAAAEDEGYTLAALRLNDNPLTDQEILARWPLPLDDPIETEPVERGRSK